MTQEVWLSTFSFESFVIYQDLNALAEVAITNPVVAALARAMAPSLALLRLCRTLTLHSRLHQHDDEARSFTQWEKCAQLDELNPARGASPFQAEADPSVS